MSADQFSQPHLLGVQGLGRGAVLSLLQRADYYADLNMRREEVPRSLRDKTLINLFFENSTRTQASFELAAKRLGATVLNMSVRGSSVSKGETLIDTATTLNAMLPDILVVRHAQAGAVALLAEKVACSVVNAGDGWHEHPTQALLDALTMRRAFRLRRGEDSEAAELEGLTIAVCGDVLHSRVARSNIFLHAALGNRVRVAGPPVLAPPALAELGAEVCGSIAEAVEGADVVMMLRLQKERMDSAEIASLREYYNQYGLKEPLLAGAAPDALVMHPGPMNRGVEIDSELADDSERSVISEQVEMGVAMRMAVLQALADHGPPPPPRRDLVTGAAQLGRFPKPTSGAAASPRPTALLNALLVDPESGREAAGGLILREGLIADLGPHVAAEAIGDAEIERIDCAGAALAPGLVDMRVFIGEPGERHKESFGSGGEAAVAGGVTTIVTQPATDPAVDDPALLDFIRQRVREESLDHAMPHVLTMAALTKGLRGEEMTEFAFLQRAGAAALSDGDRVIADSTVLRRCMETARSLDMLVCLQTQDPALSRSACATEGLVALRRGLPAATPVAETVTLARDLHLAALTGVKYHAAQISTEGSLELLQQARARGVDVTASVSATHFALCEEDIGEYRTFFKVDPPLRSRQDRSAMVAALASGAIDCVSSSHRPQDEESKRQPYEAAAAGAVGLETLLSALLGLRREAGMTLAAALRLATANPARRLGLACGRLAVGAPADLVLFDPERRRLIDRRRLRSKSKNSPFHRMEMKGHVLRTIVDGRTVYLGE